MNQVVATAALLLLTSFSWDLRSIDDEPVVLDRDGVKATAFIFVTTECPIANAYQPRLRELQKTYAGQGIQFAEVYPVANITREAVVKHRREFDIQAQCILDPDRTLAKKLGAKVTPEAVVVDRTGRILYRGRIDDQYAALGKKRPEPTQHDLDNALKAVVSGAPIATTQPQAVGCIIRF